MTQTIEYTWPVGSWRGSETVARARHTPTAGLIAVIKGSGSRKHYTLTHDVTGLSCGDFDRLSDAQLTAEALGQILDWTQPDMNRVINETSQEFRKYMRRIIFARR